MKKQPLPTCALITGAASGIGKEYVLQCAQICAALVLVDINSQGLESLRGSIQNLHSDIKIFTFPIDLSSPDAARRCLDFCNENQLEVDLLINNAGIFYFAPMLDADPIKIQRMIDLHISCITQMCLCFAPPMKTRKKGWILNMSSMSAWMAMPGISTYNATKSYIRSMSRSLYFELKPHNVSVTAVCPGGIDTSLLPLPPKLRKLACSLHFLMSPEKLVKKALKATLQRKIQTVPGLLNHIMRFFMVCTPNWMISILMKHIPIYKNFF